MDMQYAATNFFDERERSDNVEVKSIYAIEKSYCKDTQLKLMACGFFLIL